MGFERFGIVSHTKESRANPFVDYLEKGHVMATRCNHCKAIFFPPQMDCPTCIKSDMGWVEISEEGKLITFAVVSYGPAGFETIAPYTLGIVAFKHNIQVLATLSKEISTNDIHVGMPLKIAPTLSLNNKLSYEFQIV